MREGGLVARYVVRGGTDIILVGKEAGKMEPDGRLDVQSSR